MVASADDYHNVTWPAFTKLIGIDPDSVGFINIEPAAKVVSLATKKAEVVFELCTGKPFMVRAIPADQLGDFLWSEYGFNVYEHSFMVCNDVIESNPEDGQEISKASSIMPRFFRHVSFLRSRPRTLRGLRNSHKNETNSQM